MINYFEKEQKSTLIRIQFKFIKYWQIRLSAGTILNKIETKRFIFLEGLYKFSKGTEKSIACGWLRLHKLQENLKRLHKEKLRMLKI